jgi:hypothetical protein
MGFTSCLDHKNSSNNIQIDLFLEQKNYYKSFLNEAINNNFGASKILIWFFLLFLFIKKLGL